MSHTLTVEELASQLEALIRALEPGDEIALTSENRTIARIVPEPRPESKRGGFGACRGMLIENPEVDDDAHLEDFKEYM